ncbi:hypothetical protein C7M84_020107 [Penaeus vannamei]|uniref:Uncharacterized protein n=1 Tax=Penaeus vannamei TaxID=6689 RepID=A0A3R7MHT0_PENVA|nr:hypothetical protein C7M84_020107 [Penaeus vannamei]
MAGRGDSHTIHCRLFLIIPISWALLRLWLHSGLIIKANTPLFAHVTAAVGGGPSPPPSPATASLALGTCPSDANKPITTTGRWSAWPSAEDASKVNRNARGFASRVNCSATKAPAEMPHTAGGEGAERRATAACERRGTADGASDAKGDVIRAAEQYRQSYLQSVPEYISLMKDLAVFCSCGNTVSAEASGGCDRPRALAACIASSPAGQARLPADKNGVKNVVIRQLCPPATTSALTRPADDCEQHLATRCHERRPGYAAAGHAGPALHAGDAADEKRGGRRGHQRAKASHSEYVWSLVVSRWNHSPAVSRKREGAILPPAPIPRGTKRITRSTPVIFDKEERVVRRRRRGREGPPTPSPLSILPALSYRLPFTS